MRLQKPKNDSLVYKILLTLEEDRSVLVMDNHTISLRYDPVLGTLKIITPIRLILNRIFRLSDEIQKQVTSDIEVFEQVYVLESNLQKYSKDISKLRAYYESEYIFV